MKRPSARYRPRGHALTLRIVRLLHRYGPLYPAEVARILDRTPGSIFHHMENMAMNGLLVELPKGVHLEGDCRRRYFRLRT